MAQGRDLLTTKASSRCCIVILMRCEAAGMILRMVGVTPALEGVIDTHSFCECGASLLSTEENP